ncbi:hypothetical protein A2837_02140 [Candidatus Kaiserbacteria bacterium RIFCSPHIGHO2_01_FULL_46_22]|uniref:Uncharacterized protein n=1 Tax=Candidatus Kaiserbacteria bacterium RIFCSPHIGHO2_01_FULL_46_22 TaxID=1798475 RepID=A0A1F6BYE2_9BACT|nr:MAG: hypothetical protein A2837_02140 [Candidatus Kaiserbacteria bacterium RIFCSPHIGHO2_01_FULL_46_22]
MRYSINVGLYVAGLASFGVFLYYLLNEGPYVVSFLPIIEGFITVGLLIFALFYLRAVRGIENHKYAIIPHLIGWWVGLMTLFVFFEPGFLLAFFLPAGGLGIPLAIAAVYWSPIMTALPTPLGLLPLLLLPAIMVWKETMFLARSLREGSGKYLVANLIVPILVVLGCVAILLVSNANVVRVKNADSVSYKTGKSIQHLIEQHGWEQGYFPKDLNELVNKKMLNEIPVSNINNRPYTYTVQDDKQNYLLCFPQTEGERCEKSWSRSDDPEVIYGANERGTGDLKISIAWRLIRAEEVDNVVYTNVSAVINGTTYEIGKFRGYCNDVGSGHGIDTKGLLAGEIDAAQCWLGESGNEIGIFANEDGGFDIMIGVLSEGVGGSILRHDFEVKQSIGL